MHHCKTDQQIVQQYANEGRLNELPPGDYVLSEPIMLPPAATEDSSDDSRTNFA